MNPMRSLRGLQEALAGASRSHMAPQGPDAIRSVFHPRSFETNGSGNGRVPPWVPQAEPLANWTASQSDGRPPSMPRIGMGRT
jgi:hypothetical protein